MPSPVEHPLPRDPYRNLVLLALLTLSGRPPAHDLLQRAHRSVTASLPWGRRNPRAHEYARVRRRVLRRALRDRGTRRHAGLRITPLDGVGPLARALAPLDGLDPAARAGLALVRIERMAPEQAVALLRSVGVRDPDRALDQAADVPDGYGPPDPTVVRVSGRGAPPGPPLLVAAGAAGLALVLAAVALGGSARPEERRGPMSPAVTATAITDPRAWRESFRLDLSAWHARGGAVDDEALVGEAVAAWADRGEAPRDPRLVFAGRVDGRDVVVLHDTPWTARYTRDGEDSEVEVFAEPANGVANWPALRLSETAEGVRYLLPPWVTEAAWASLGAPEDGWSEAALDGHGVTGPVAAGEHCGTGPVLRLRAPEVAHGQPYTVVDLDGFSTAHLGYMPPPPAEIRRLGPHEVLDPEHGFDLWGEAACAGGVPRGAVVAATAWEFAEQELPGGGTGRWVCVRYGTHDGGGLARAVLVAEGEEGTEAITAGERRGGWECSNLDRQVAAGTWWQADDGRWHYLAAASREVADLRVSGAADGGGDGPVLAAEGPRRGDGPPAGTVTVSAVNVHGDPMTLFAD
ncbi:hypothetical protein [Nocardiopsis sp. NRRL B-16309]|uniref:hypothetical protein n=1 Tax=Nocardiopsis sp. NRRL B-16309 TaxID=1519494 RepID=UPI0006B01631|nr:hypothetical protein [Nocardiopsis sp. NRRL B-16309]KOX22052.1 hypothetical protein ADL05_03130 [Nocardiopsis sp. NRRL B-16309]